MKKQFILSIFAVVAILSVIPQKSYGAHFIGGDITYRYIGDSTNIANHYEISMVLHESNRWANVGVNATQTICIRSSCFPTSNLVLNRIPGQPAQGTPVPNQAECIDINSPEFTPVREHMFRGTTTLAGPCSDWRFSFKYLCCRVGVNFIANVNTYPPGDNYLEAKLNNSLGQNTSPQWLNPPAKSFCTNNSFIWPQRSVEPDNDSLEYSFGHPLNSGNACGPSVNILFDPPYTVNNPIPTVPGTLNIRNDGVFEFTTTGTQGTFIMAIYIKEMRYYPAGNFYYEVGEVMRELMVNVVDDCLQIVQDGPRLDPAFTTTSMVPTSALKFIGTDIIIPHSDSVPDPNSPTGYSMEWPVVEYDCFDSIITLHFAENVQCETISEDASEFRLVGPDTNLVPIVDVDRNCNINLQTKSVNLYLHTPLAAEGDYFLYIKEGTDGNTILNDCGFPMAEYTAIVIRVLTCPTPEYDIKNISVINNDHIEISWEADSVGFPLHAVTNWHFFRSDDQGATFNKIGRRGGANAGYATSWLDRTVDNEDVNSQTYQYQMQMEISRRYFMFTRDVTSIFLQKGQGYGQNRNYPLEWNEYNGWLSPQYNLMIWDIDSTGIWSLATQPGNPTSNNNINFNYDLISNRRGHSFALRIDAKDLGGGGMDYTAMSNYVYMTVPIVPPIPPPPPGDVDELVIPNVFTPDGDGKNDVFAIKGIEGFRSAEVIITNRWGNVVFKDNNFTKNNAWDGRDMHSGRMVADGAYFYIIRLRGSVMGLPDVEETGSLTIFGSGSR